jgi:hypothetical protein
MGNRMLAAIPLLVLPALVYNLVVLTLPGGVHAAGASQALAAPLVVVPMASGGGWPVSLGDVLLAASLVILFIELLKGSEGQKAALINHFLSTLLFVACLVEFLLLRGFGTSVFFLITLMALLDVLAGFIVSIFGGRAGGGTDA